ncbi:MAG: alpha/beta hydrolase [Patescibacteria group bacterium]
MKTAIILHGMPSKKEYFNSKSQAQSSKHWLPWLQRQLILKGALAQTVELPEPYKPVYKKWRSAFEQFILRKDTMLIGHSCGAGFLVRWLSENKKIKVGKVALVAPWLDPDHWLKTGFFNFTIDPNLAKRTHELIIFVSKDDNCEMLKSVKMLKETLKGGNITVKEFTDKGHFTFGDMKTEKFPELLKALIS